MHHNVYLKKNSNCLFNTVYNNYICSLLLKTVYIIGVRSRGRGGGVSTASPNSKVGLPFNIPLLTIISPAPSSPPLPPPPPPTPHVAGIFRYPCTFYD